MMYMFSFVHMIMLGWALDTMCFVFK